MDNQQFQGFPVEGLKFLAGLKRNNTREWFNKNKSLFKESVEAPARAFAREMEGLLTGISNRPMTSKVFRIYRDVRFSKDRTPYNTHVHMSFFCADGDRSECGAQPAFHFGLEAKKISVGIGSFGFPKDLLAAYRTAVDKDSSGERLQTLLKKYSASKGYHLDDPELKRVPSGYDKDHPRADLLRRKGLVLWHEKVPDKSIHSDRATKDVLKRLEAMKPVYDWLAVL